MATSASTAARSWSRWAIGVGRRSCARHVRSERAGLRFEQPAHAGAYAGAEPRLEYLGDDAVVGPAFGG